MADGVSKREQIILKVVEILENVQCVRTVKRKHPVDLSELQDTPTTILPIIGVTGGLPEVQKTWNSSGGLSEKAISSNLRLTISFFAHEPKEPDSKISQYLNELWVAIYSDQLLDGLAHDMLSISPSIEEAVIPPYIGFYLDVDIQYIHSTKYI